jgi:tetratricopeptide (TPR) repeat protein
MKNSFLIVFCFFFLLNASAQNNFIDLGTDTIIFNPDFEYIAAIETADYMESYVFYQSALRSFQNKDLFSANLYISKAIKLNKKEPKFKLLKAWVLSADEQYNKAIKLAKSVLVDYPKNQEAIYCKAMNHYLLGSYATAIANYDLLLKIDPNDYKAWMGKAESRMKLKQYQTAILDYSAALQNKSNLVAAYKGRGLAYYNIYDFKSAIRDFNQMIVAVPNDGQMYYYRAMCNLKLNEYTNACKDFEAAVRNNYKAAQSYLDKNCKL